jgi:hypothetical protein
MGQRTLKVLQGDLAKAARFSPEDLEFFAKVLNDILMEFSLRRDTSGDRATEAEMKVELAVALLKCADSGDRDCESLKRKALAALESNPARSVGASSTDHAGVAAPVGPAKERTVHAARATAAADPDAGGLSP